MFGARTRMWSIFEVVGGTVEVEGHAVRRVACVAEAAFEGAVFSYVGHFDGDVFNWERS